MVFIKPEDVWDHFNQEFSIPGKENQILNIASDEESGITITLSADYDHMPEFTVFNDDVQEVESQVAYSKESCEEIAFDLYSAYIEEYSSGENHVDNLSSISYTESYIRSAVIDLLETVSDDPYSVSDIKEDDIEGMVNDILALLSIKYKVDIYRPMYVKDENGDSVYVEYPYKYFEEQRKKAKNEQE